MSRPGGLAAENGGEQLLNGQRSCADRLLCGVVFFVLSAEPELVLVDMCAARGSLVSITSRVDTEDILTRFFPTFCPGK